MNKGYILLAVALGLFVIAYLLWKDFGSYDLSVIRLDGRMAWVSDWPWLVCFAELRHDVALFVAYARLSVMGTGVPGQRLVRVHFCRHSVSVGGKQPYILIFI